MNRLTALAATASLLLCPLFCSACVADSPSDPGVEPAIESLNGAVPEARHPICDFNRNGIDDAIDISTFNSLDENLNGIPDEAE